MCPYPTCNSFLTNVQYFLSEIPTSLATSPLSQFSHTCRSPSVGLSWCKGRDLVSSIIHCSSIITLPSLVECKSGSCGCGCVAIMKIRASTLAVVGMKARETWVPGIIFKPLNQPLAGNSRTCSVLNSKLLFPKKFLVGFSAYLQPNTFLTDTLIKLPLNM